MCAILREHVEENFSCYKLSTVIDWTREAWGILEWQICNKYKWNIIQNHRRFLKLRKGLFISSVYFVVWIAYWIWMKKINIKCILFKLKDIHHIQMQQLNGYTRTILKLLIPQHEALYMQNEMKSTMCQSSRLLAAFAFWYMRNLSKICYVRKEISGFILLFLVEKSPFLCLLKTWEVHCSFFFLFYIINSS